MRMAYLYAGSNVIESHCEQSQQCTVSIRHAAGEDVASASITFAVKAGKARVATLQCLPGALQAAMDALKPGGLFISKTPCLNDMNPLIPKLALPLMRALGKAPHVLCFNAAELQAALVQQGLEIVSVERHGTKGRDFRPFIVARKPDGHRPSLH